MIRTVVTAFTAFGGMTANPTIELTRRLVEGSNNRLRRVVMPTSYRASEGILDRIVSRRPDVLVMFGYTSETDRLRLEHVARNRDGSPFPDNDGRYGRRFVIPGAPAAYRSTVGFGPVVSELARRSIPFTYSIDAGDYVCNHSYFWALNRVRSARPVIKCVFVHIPIPRSRAEWSEVTRGALVVLQQCGARAAPAARVPAGAARSHL